MLPPHLSESLFRRYEPYITDLVSTWPAGLIVRNFTSYNTFTCRFRDACRTFHQNGQTWLTTINREKFKQIYRSPADKDFEVVFVAKEQLIKVQPLAHVRLEVESAQQTANNIAAAAVLPPTLNTDIYLLKTPEKISIDQTVMAEFIAFLAHERLLSRPIKFENLSKQIAQKLSDQYDILLDEKEDGTVVIS